MEPKTLTYDTNNPHEWPYVLTLKDVSAITKISKSKLLSMAANEELPVKRVRGRWLINKDSFLGWLAS